jgi:hypothetical protein
MGKELTNTIWHNSSVALVCLIFRQVPKEQLLGQAQFENQGISPGDIVFRAGRVFATASDQIPSYAYLPSEAAGYRACIPVQPKADRRCRHGKLAEGLLRATIL